MMKYKTVQSSKTTDLVYANGVLIGTIEQTWKGYEAYSVQYGYLGIQSTLPKALTILQNFLYNRLKTAA
jgi:hypothetical protein